MIAHKITSKVPLEHGKKYKYRVRIVSEECFSNTEQFRIFKHDLLRKLAEDPELSQCGDRGFTKLTMEHNGKVWEVVCEAIVEEKPTTT